MPARQILAHRDFGEVAEIITGEAQLNSRLQELDRCPNVSRVVVRKLIELLQTGIQLCLSALDGAAVSATWTLYITDHVGNDSGNLNAWSITIESF